MSMRLALVLSALFLLFVFLLLFVRGLNKKKEEEDVKNIIDVLSEDADKAYYVAMTKPEKYFVSRFKIPAEKAKTFVYSVRLILALLAVVSFMMFGVIGIGVFIAAMIYVVMENSKKEEIERSGVTKIPITVAFMDFFVPQVASGSSSTQAFIKYIDKLDDKDEYKKLLTEYYDNKKNDNYSYKTPESIKDITSVYENALYNEQMGSENYLYIIQEAKADLFQKSVYYSDYESKVGEVLKPIEFAYYAGVPIIIALLYSTTGDFWFTIPGLITAIALIILFYMFKFLVNRLAIKTLKEILS